MQLASELRNLVDIDFAFWIEIELLDISFEDVARGPAVDELESPNMLPMAVKLVRPYKMPKQEAVPSVDSHSGRVTTEELVL